MINRISENVLQAKFNIEKALSGTGRAIDDITIIGVTKTVDIDIAEMLLDCGINNFGENRVQEFIRKYDAIGDKAVWHLIGHLQKNKIKYIVGKTKLIHSVDSIELLEEISKHSIKESINTNVLVQVNVSGEESKFGIKKEYLKEFCEKGRKLPNISINGIMTMAPFTEDKDYIKRVMDDANKVFLDIQGENGDNMNIKYLSMGMSNDYEIALQSGANILRIGTALFR